MVCHRSPETIPAYGAALAPHTAMQAGTNLWEAAGWLGMTVEQLEQNYGHHHPSRRRLQRLSEDDAKLFCPSTIAAARGSDTPRSIGRGL
jgi:hypothetical protein